MKKRLLLVVGLIAMGTLFACNKQKTVKLDYSQKMQDGTLQPQQGLPGSSTPGRSEANVRYHGDKAKQDAVQPEEKKPEEQPKPADDTQADDTKADDTKAKDIQEKTEKTDAK